MTPRTGSFSMEETVPTELSLNYSTSGYLDYWDNIKEECSSVTVGLMVFVGVCIGICLCGFVGNGTVVWFLGFHVKKNPFNIYILNLAVADFSLLLVVFLLLLTVLTVVAFCLPDFISFYLNLVFIVDILCHFFDLCSLCFLTAISVERCISVLFPIWYRCHRPKRLSGITCGVLWALAGLFVSSSHLSIYFDESYGTVFVSVHNAIYLILMLVILIFDLALFIKLRCGSQRRYPGKLYVALLLNAIFFFALSIPFNVGIFIHFQYLYKLFMEIIPFLLPLLTCSLDPITYFLVGFCRQRRIQCSLKVAFRRLFEEKEIAEEGNPTPEDVVVEITV